MKILDRKAFLALPAGTLFHPYEPCIFGEMSIKDTSIGEIDFFEVPLNAALDVDNTDDLINKLEDSRLNGTSIDMDFETVQREGLYDDRQLYAVFERADMEQLITRLQKALSAYAERRS